MSCVSLSNAPTYVLGTLQKTSRPHPLLAIFLCLAGTGISACAPAIENPTQNGAVEYQTLGKQQRYINTDDLISIRDIGGYTGAISISPDGKHVAFHLQQGDATSNTYKTGWYVVPVTPNADELRLGDGGDVILVGEMSGVTNGSRVALSAKWSPDSEWIAYRRKENNEIQLWRSRKDGSDQEQLTNDQINISAFHWSANGSRLFFKAQPSNEAIQAVLDEEGKRGFLFDERFSVNYSTRPHISDPINLFPDDSEILAGWHVYSFSNETHQPAQDTDLEELSSLLSRPHDNKEQYSKNDIRKSILHHAGHRLAWFENENPATFPGFAAPLTLYAESENGSVERCAATQCNGHLEQLYWSEDGRDVYFVRREGVNRLQRGFYAWSPGSKTVRNILQTDEWIYDCELAASSLLCLHEDITTPRKIISLDLHSGSIATIFDPNTSFHEIQFTNHEKLTWREKTGTSAAGHLIYPANFQEGERYPLIVVQYRSKGFLRGGVGNEYPIHPLAAEGFFVLSFDRPENHRVAGRITDLWEAERASWGEDIWERKSALSALEIIIDELDIRGLIDPNKVGITGLSDGAETVWYAMIHSDKFAAAAASDGGWSPSWYYLISSDLRKNYFGRAAELPPPGSGNLERWARISPEFHADKINTPILVQVADRELVQSVAGIGALQDAGQPVEAYVFPNEYHVKWQPKHKHAVYNRTIDWFNFWLRNIEDDNPEKASQYDRWRRLKDSRNR